MHSSRVFHAYIEGNDVAYELSQWATIRTYIVQMG